MNYYFITGGSRGIGAALISELAQQANTSIWNYSRKPYPKTEVCNNMAIDFSAIDSLEDFAFPNISDATSITLINNAGVIGEIAPVGQKSNSAIINTYRVNTIAPCVLSNVFVAQFQSVKAAKFILNISSGAGRHTIKSWAEYCASKAAVDMHAMVMAEEQKGQAFPIKICSLAPGVIDTKMQEEIRAVSRDKFENLDYFIDLKQNQQLDSPEFVAQKILKNFAALYEGESILKDLRHL